MDLNRGANSALQGARVATVHIRWCSSPAPLDVSCFMVGADGKVVSDSHMVFYNQMTSPCGALRLTEVRDTGATFVAQLDAIAADVERCVFSLALDGEGAMRDVRALEVDVLAPPNQSLKYRIKDVESVRALIAAELYRHKDAWKVRAVGQGFNGGPRPLAEHHGVTVADEEAPSAQPIGAGQLAGAQRPVEVGGNGSRIDLLKRKVAVSLGKRRLAGERARVAVVIDGSGSMDNLFKNGTVQRAFERVLAVAACLDDDGAMDVWFFADRPFRAPEATVRNFDGYIERLFPSTRAIRETIGGRNNEPAVIEDVLAKYVSEEPRPGFPALVLFFSDGGVSKNGVIAQLIRECSGQPIFWQFIGIGNAKYGVLEKLDTLSGRMVDNAGFFALDDLDKIEDAELYDRILSEFPLWLSEARRLGILNR